MRDWKVIYKQEEYGLSVGMWVESVVVYFTLEKVIPEDVIGQDIEFGISIPDLMEILSQAQEYRNMKSKSLLIN